MGGNVIFNGVAADSIDLTKHNRTDVIENIYFSLFSVSKSYQTMFNIPLWDNELFNTRGFFSGSSTHLFSPCLSTKEIIDNKPYVNDIDVQVDKTFSDNIQQFLSENIGQSFKDLILFGFKKSAGQFITLWFSNSLQLHVQIDFELVDFENGKPTEWSRFSHSSSWDDILLNIKGFHHKYLLQSMMASDKEPIIILTGKKRTPKPTNKSKWAFSVQRGLRLRYVETDQIIDGLKVYDELETKDSVFYTDLETISNKLFPIDDNTTYNFIWSFIDIVDYLKLYKSETEQLAIVNDFFDRMFGDKVQMIVRDDLETDRILKMHGFEYILKQLNIDLDQYLPLIDEYYKQLLIKLEK